MGREQAWGGQLLLRLRRHVGDGQDILEGVLMELTKAPRSTCGVPPLGQTQEASAPRKPEGVAAVARQQGTSWCSSGGCKRVVVVRQYDIIGNCT